MPTAIGQVKSTKVVDAILIEKLETKPGEKAEADFRGNACCFATWTYREGQCYRGGGGENDAVNLGEPGGLNSQQRSRRRRY